MAGKENEKEKKRIKAKDWVVILLLICGLLAAFAAWGWIAYSTATVEKVVETVEITKEVPVEVTRIVKKEVPVEVTKIVEKVVEKEVVVTPTPEPTETPVPTATSALTVAAAALPAFPLYDSEGGIPFPPATSWAVDVAPDEIEVYTCGPAVIAGISLPGGENRGSVILMLPGDRVVAYQIDNVISGAGWHGSYRPLASPGDESTWRVLAEDRVEAMQAPPNCTSGEGCAVVDVLIIGPGSVVIDQWTVE